MNTHQSSDNRVCGGSRDGSIYLVTVITVAAIVTMVLVGVRLRSAGNAQSALIESMSESNNELIDATEYAIQAVVSDQAWAYTAQSGVAFPDVKFNDSIYSSTVVDADTGLTPDDQTTTYRVRMNASSPVTNHSAQFSINGTKIDYLGTIKAGGPLFYWPLNDASGTTVATEYVESQHGRYNSASTPASDHNDYGAPVASFTNSSDQVGVSWDNDMAQNNGSVSMWIKYTGPAFTTTASPFLGMRYAAGDTPTINMAVYNNSIWAYIDSSGSYTFSHALNTPVGSIVNGTWHHVAMTWGSAGFGIYIDGVQLAMDKSNTEGVDTHWFNGSRPLFIGAGYNMFLGHTPFAGFQGSVAHVVYMNHDLNEEQAATLATIKPDELTLTLVEGSWEPLFNE